MTDLSRYDNSHYHPGAGIVKRTIWYFVNVALMLNRWCPLSRPRVWALRLFGAKIGKGVVIHPGVNIKYPWHLSVGNYTWFGEGVWIDNLAPVTIGSNCCLSQGAMLLCGNHNYRQATFDLIVRPITIGDGAWVGAKAVVCPGVTIGAEAVATVGSVVTHDLPARTINGIKPRRKE